MVRTGRWEPTFTAKRTNGSAKQRADTTTIEASGKFHLPLRNTTFATRPPPLPRSEKGSGAESLSGPDLFVNAGMKPGPLTAVLKDGIRTYYVMVGLDGSVELSCPVIEKGKFVHWMERIYIYSPDSDREADPQTDTGPIEDFDITVSFKH